jgi:predicted hotdog family 3-hydroxylacyl-ACP dehydratase
MPIIGRAELAPLLPHGGAMRLLDQVERWDQSSICCRTSSHRDEFNPLRHHGTLPAIAALEYAAQAMGVHVGLLNRERQTEGLIGYVGGLRDVVVSVQRLDDVRDDLRIEALRLAEGEDSFLYRFDITAGDRPVMAGRASIFVKQRA